MTNLPSTIQVFLQNKSAKSVELFYHFYDCFQIYGDPILEVTKTTIAFGQGSRQCYIYQFGKNFISGVLRMPELYDDPTIFFKAAAVSSKTFAHHFRLYEKEDITTDFMKYIKITAESGKN